VTHSDRSLAVPALDEHHAVQDRPVGSVGTVSPAPMGPGRTCASCGRALAGRRPNAQHCSATCRRRVSALRRGCPRCRGRLVVDPATLDLAALDDAVTLAAVATLDTMAVARVYAARRALSRVVQLLGSPA
jgi:hypothetical protein